MTNQLAETFNIPIPKDLTTNGTILVVEDQQDLRLIVVHHLSKMQFRNVIQAQNGLEAMEKLRTANPKVDLIICDQNMPVMGGLDLLAELQEDVQLDRVPFCMAIDHVSKEKLMYAVECGVDEIMVKPFTLSDIAPKMRKAFKVFHNPRNPEKVYEIAKTYLREKSYTEANGVYTKLAASAPKAARPLVGMARTHLYEGKHQEAHKFLQLAESRNPNYVHTFSVRGELFMAEGNVEKAIEAYSHGISLSPLNPVRYVQVVEPLMALKRYEEIAEILQKALAAKVEFPLLYHFISQAFFHLKDYKAAIRYIRLAIQADEDNLDYLNQLAISYKESGMLEDAMKTYNKMIKYDPDNLVGLFNKAILLESTNHLDEALKLMERIQQKYPDDVRVQEKLADLRAPKQSA